MAFSGFPPSSMSFAGFPPSSKVCLITCCSPTESLDFCRIYLIDFKEEGGGDEYSYRSPSICINYEELGYVRFCVYGSLLFLFDDWMGVFTYHLPRKPIFNVNLRKNDVVRVPSLNYRKFGLECVTTPDARLLVFSTNLPQNYGGETDRDFEIYSSELGKWITLPGISPVWRTNGPMLIQAHCFVRNLLLLQTEKYGFFAIDMENPHVCAKNLRTETNLPRLPPVDGFGYFVVIDTHDLYLTKNLGIDIGIGKGSHFTYPGLHLLENHRRAMRNVQILYLSDKQCKFCVSQVQINDATLRPYLQIYMYRLDLQEYAKEMRELDIEEYVKQLQEGKTVKILPATEVIKSFKFYFDAEDMDDTFAPLSLYAFY